MSKKGAKAEQYAQAAYQAFVQTWQNAFVQIGDLLSGDQELYSFLMDGSRPFVERETALMDTLPDDIPPDMVNLLKLLVQEEDLDLLPRLPVAMAQINTGQLRPVSAEVTSAVELTDGEKTALRKKLGKEFDTELIISFSVDPDLMGGLRVRVGDRLIDTSIASRLAALRESVAAVVR